MIYDARMRLMSAFVGGWVIVAPPWPNLPQARADTPPNPVPVIESHVPQAQTKPDGGDVPVPEHSNHLIHETSPYLLQHAHNPVEWYPWGTEAFEKARKEDKLIFLSIGYSTCYWCHVMERECFENQAIAAQMNRDFVCIKVDREERPDVDDVYMTATQILTGSGGWPMSVFLEPATLKPFLAGTYFPPEDAMGRPGFPTVLRQMVEYWKTKRDAVNRQAGNIADGVREHMTLAAVPAAIGPKTVEKAISVLMADYDAKNGGFGAGSQRVPKFPTPVNLDFLMGAAWNLKPAREAVIFTLDRMAIGGMYDQIGGGFHRYSTDEKWLVPHFEKMLYDNGQLASTYAQAFELTKDPFYAQIVRQTLDYVLREMTDPSGGFHSAQDAEVNSREGDNYLWLPDEIRAAIEKAAMKDDADFAIKLYGVDSGTNFQDPHHSELPPRNVLFLSDRPDKVAQGFNLSLDDFNNRRARVNAALLKTRTARDQPRFDDKILAGWNGLMIAGMADGGRVLNEKKYIDAGTRAAMFVLKKMRGADGSLMRSSRGGQARIDAFLEDYALVIHGLVTLHRATGNFTFLDDAKALAKIAKSKFWDSTGSGGYFDTLEGQSDLFVRVKTTSDGAIPSGNSVMLINLIDLHEATGEAAYLDDAAALARGLSSVLSQRPTGSPLAMLGVHRLATKYPAKLDAQGTVAKPSFSFEQAPPVALNVEPNEVTVKPGTSAMFNVVVRINPAYHISSHEPGDEDLVPLKIDLVGCEGLKITVTYPKGEAHSGPSVTGTVNVHKREVSIPVKVEQTGVLSGMPRVTLKYQACTDKECLEPKTEIVGIRIIAQK